MQGLSVMTKTKRKIHSSKFISMQFLDAMCTNVFNYIELRYVMGHATNP
jgi:hypothetical protein